MDLSRLENLLGYLNLVVVGLLAFRLAWQKLRGVYPYLFAYALADTAQGVAALIVRRDPAAYFYVYTGGQAVKLVLSGLVVLELYGLILADRQAIARVGRKLAGYLLLGAMAVASLNLAVAPPNVPRGAKAILQYLRAYERTVDLVVLLLLVAMIAFVSWFPVRITRNQAYYIAAFCVYFLAQFAGFLALNSYPQHRAVVSVAELAMTLICIGGMALGIGRLGERESIVAGHRWNPAEMERLSRRLDAINTALNRSGS
jgi:hypothetical protein